MSEESPKFFKLFKNTPNDVIFYMHSASNPDVKKLVRLTRRAPSVMLPADWAIGILIDDESYKLYRKGLIGFEKNNELVKLAYEKGLFYNDELDFTPVDKDNTDVILAILKTGNRKSIDDAIASYGMESVRNVAIAYADNLTQGVVRMLESIFKIQLVMDGDEAAEM